MKRYNRLKIEIVNDPDSIYSSSIGDHHHEGDIGFDLYIPCKMIIPGGAANFKIPLGIACSMTEDSPIKGTEMAYLSFPVGYMLAPRSSMGKLGLRQSNSIGFIDAGYRGEITLPVDNINDSCIELEPGDRICQLVGMNGWEIKHEFVEKLSETDRGDGGFGSTGK